MLGCVADIGPGLWFQGSHVPWSQPMHGGITLLFVIFLLADDLIQRAKIKYDLISQERRTIKIKMEMPGTKPCASIPH